MANKLFVGNLAWEVGFQDLQDAFSAYGNVTDAFVAKDKFTGRSRGFGFVTFEKDEEAEAAKAALHDADLKGRPMMVDYATDRPNDNAPASE